MTLICVMHAVNAASHLTDQLLQPNQHHRLLPVLKKMLVRNSRNLPGATLQYLVIDFFMKVSIAWSVLSNPNWSNKEAKE